MTGEYYVRMKKKEHVYFEKLIYTFLILLVYIVGKSLPLYGIDISVYMNRQIEAEDLLIQTISGDLYQCSLFALGISPYMISSIVVQIASACMSEDARKRISPKKKNQVTIAATFFIAIVQAILHVYDLQFDVTLDMLQLTYVIAVIEMVTGVVAIIWLTSRNKQYGIGGQTALILVNIIDGIKATLVGREIEEIIIPLGVAFAGMIIMLFMENTEKRIPLQRISIHNIYADKNYLAIKMNPIGVMPAMFSTAFFMLPQLIIAVLLWIFPNNANLIWWQERMSLSEPLGMIIYIVILYCLTIGFSVVFINPKDITEQYLKSGDSFEDIHAGRDTRRYLAGTIGRISVLSATVMSICLGVPLYLQYRGNIDSSLVMLPSSIMMLTGIWCNLYREAESVKNLEAYKPFI